jgi:hypothetical protein
LPNVRRRLDLSQHCAPERRAYAVIARGQNHGVLPAAFELAFVGSAALDGVPSGTTIAVCLRQP